MSLTMAASRPAVTLRLSAQLREKVLRSGYTTVADLRAIPITDFAKELKLTPVQAQDLQQQLHPNGPRLTPFTADQTWEQEKKLAPITTSSPALDSFFGGAKGIPPGKITEICGLPGTGKTQLGMQLSINAQMPRSMGGAGGSSIYIDTEGSFVARRASQLADACAHRMSESKPALSTEDLLRGIQYCRVHSPVELIAMVRILGGILQDPKMHVKLVVLDSISFLFRSNFSDTHMRTKLVASLGRQLAELARQYDLAGGHGQRYARLFKSPTMQEQTIAFHVGPDGISDVVDPEPAKAVVRSTHYGDDDDIDFDHTSTESMLWDIDDFS
ncbi:hypothetical protein BGX33_009382 [Mortierella sp. NVP41]|nr:hypothetical protein BGX33_009382 [Mortierella sp. NVP41]